MKAVWAVLMALLLAACTPESTDCARLPGGARYCLQASGEVAPFAAQQQITVDFQGRRETLLAQIEVDADGLRAVALTPLGQRLLWAEFAGGALRAEGLARERLDPALWLALIQIAHWDAPAVRAGLRGSADLLDEAAGRRLVRDGKTLVRIGYTRGRPPAGDMDIDLPEAGVRFQINTLDESQEQ